MICLGKKNEYQGIKVYFPKIKQIKLLRSAHLILATGGAGQVFQASSNPPSAIGDGLAMAIRAGAKVADLEYFQFHPTALFQPGAVRNLLITEALRGAGAFVINNKGERFLFSIDPRGELATRDIVTRVIMEEMGKNDADCVYLDARHIGKERLLSEFPQVYENCLLEGYDLSKLGKMGMGASVTIVTFILRFTGYLSENIIEKTMQYYHSKTLPNTSVDTLRPKVEAALKEEGFGILTEIDIQATMKKKLGKDYLPHLILGACNPVYADKVLTIAPQISTMLPCNVTLRELEDGGVEVSIIDPLAAMGVVENPDIEIHAAEVNDKLKKVLASI